jgi:hypothetical protein
MVRKTRAGKAGREMKRVTRIEEGMDAQKLSKVIEKL